MMKLVSRSRDDRHSGLFHSVVASGQGHRGIDLSIARAMGRHRHFAYRCGRTTAIQTTPFPAGMARLGIALIVFGILLLKFS